MEQVLQGHVSEKMQTAWLGQHELPRDKPCLPNLTAFAQEDRIRGQGKSSGCHSLHLQGAFQTVLENIHVSKIRCCNRDECQPDQER